MQKFEKDSKCQKSHVAFAALSSRRPSFVRLRINCAISSNDMYNYYVNHGTTERLYFRDPESEFTPLMRRNDERLRRRRSLFFQGLLAGSWGYIHQTPSAPIVSLHLRSSGDLQDPFDRLCICLSTDRGESSLRIFACTSLSFISRIITRFKRSKILKKTDKSLDT